MATQDDKTIVRRFFEEAWNRDDAGAVDRLVATDPTHVGADQLPGAWALKEFIRLYRAGLPDLTFDIADQVAEDGKVATRWTVSGTHDGELMGAAPTGKRVTIDGMSLYRVESGTIVEGWDSWDKLALQEQLGVVPRLHERNRQSGE